jgi:hypothetical protein
MTRAIRNSIIVLFCSCCAAMAQDRIGYVADVKGQWSLNGSAEPLSLSDAVPAGGVLRLVAADGVGNSYIVINSRVGEPLDSRTCEDQTRCSPITLPSSLQPSSSALSRIYGAVMEFLHQDAKRYRSAISRSARLDDAVIRLSGDQIDMTEALKNSSARTLLLQFVPRDTTEGKPLAPVTFHWDPANSTPLRVPGITPGVYQVDMLDPDSKFSLGPSERMWLLLLEPGDFYDKASREFKTIESETERWKTAAPAGGARPSERAIITFLRAYLGFLASQRPR